MIRFAVAFVLLALTATYVHLNPPADLDAGRGVLRTVPASFGPWIRQESGLQDGVKEDLQADDAILRRYEADGHSVWLCLVYHENRRYGAHDPRVCYETQGFVILDEGRASVDSGTPGGMPVQTFAVRRKGDARVVWYWWTTEGLSTGDVSKFRGRMAFLGALENRSWGAFVRVEAEAPDGDLNAASARARDFSARVAHELPELFARARSAAATRP